SYNEHRSMLLHCFSYKGWAVVLLAAASINMHAATKEADFGKMPDGTPIKIYTLTNKNGVEAKITNYGGIITSLSAPDRAGKMADVVLGFDSLAGYLSNPGPYLGALIGRYGNRIGKAQFTLNGHEYHLEKNDGANTLHGGLHGFDKRVWSSQIQPDG